MTAEIHLAWLITSWFVTAFMGALGGAFSYGFWVGRWKGKIEGEIESARKSREGIHKEIQQIERRLEQGDLRFESLPAFKVQIEGLTSDLRELRPMLREFVTRSECDRRHERRPD